MRKKIIFNIFLFIVLPLLFIAFIELGLRIFVHFRYGKPGRSYGIYVGDKELGAVHRPNSYNSNSVMNNWGFRNTEDISEEKPKNATRIYCSGGSTTFCYNLYTEEAWPSVLQQNLRMVPGHERDEVLNAGEITFGIANEFALARRLIPRLKPDIVIFYGSGINEQECARTLTYKDKKDLDQLLLEKKWGVFTKKLDQARFLKRNSLIVKAFDYYILACFQHMISSRIKENEAATQQKGYPHPWTIENFRQTLSNYIDFLRSNGCKVIMVLYGDNGESDASLRDYILPFREFALEVGEKKQVTIFDFASVIENLPIRQREALFYTAVHLNKEGAELLASALLPVVLRVCEKVRR